MTRRKADCVIDYQGKVTLITGGASGIGKAMAEGLAARGARVIIADMNAEAADAVARTLGGLALTIDLAEDAAASRLIMTAYDWKGQLDLVCANAGYGRSKRILEERFDEAMIHLFAVNLFAPLRLAQAYAAVLIADGGRGRLMITGSENSLSLPGAVRRSALGAYGATKHAVLIMAEWLKEELAGEIMDIHILLPGGVDTPLTAQHRTVPKQLAPNLKIILPEECAQLAIKGMDLGLFYIPTHAHIAGDLRPRLDGVLAGLDALGLKQ
jgi:NAD(P)-dependent dehydrogenase (short-subunit alcohol dehydrogenase family)